MTRILEVKQFAFVIAMMLCIVVGCNRGPKLYDIQGVVNVDGTATEGVKLLFFKKGSSMASATGVSGANGVIATHTDGVKGIELGDYDVAVTYPDPQFKTPATTMGQTPPDPPDLFKGKYFSKKVPVSIGSSSDKITIEVSLKK